MYKEFKEFVKSKGKEGTFAKLFAEFESIFKDAWDAKKDIVPLGKYKGERIDTVLQLNKGQDYFKWLVKQSFFIKGDFKHLKSKLKEAGIIQTKEDN